MHLLGTPVSRDVDYPETVRCCNLCSEPDPIKARETFCNKTLKSCLCIVRDQNTFQNLKFKEQQIQAQLIYQVEIHLS